VDNWAFPMIHSLITFGTNLNEKMKLHIIFVLIWLMSYTYVSPNILMFGPITQAIGCALGWVSCER